MQSFPLDVEPTFRGGGRYEVRALVGTGGSATVHEVFDSVRGVTLALKRLSPDAARKQTAALLFRREYRTLRELSHPAIVRAFEYGVDGGTPYYTMELASGSDLRALAPMGWKEACALLRDVASALSLVHSRRLVHRDVTPANVRRTPDGRTMLLDFGSLCPMGVAHEVVGTAPFVPPESLDGRPLDARSDLFSLGALAYYLLTGKHAYPAHRLSDLKRVWSHVPDAPSTLVAGIPESIDVLVSSLLNLNPLARPAAAAEVFDRLSTAAGLPANESSMVALGYLAAPTLVGRDDAVARFRRRLLAADRGRGSALVIEGRPGYGRSRLLGCLVTEATLANVVTLYAHGVEGRNGVFGVARALARRLLEADPVHARESLPEGGVLETLGIEGGDAGGESAPPDQWRARIEGVAKWFANVSSRVPIAIAIDDIDDADDASVAVIAKLAEVAPTRRLLVVATARATQGRSWQRLRRIGGSHALRALRASETRVLLHSIFGDGANIEMISAWVHELSEGCPRVALELSQHLVDSGVARYEHGGWVLPMSLTGLDLPQSLEQAILARLGGLSPPARRLAEGLSLCVEGEPLSLEEYPVLLGTADSEQLFTALNDLVAAQVLVGSGGSYAFVHDAMRAAVARSVPAERRKELHEKIAGIYGSDTEQASVISAHQLLLAGDERGAFATLSRFIAERAEYVVRGYRFLRSPDGGALYERLFGWGLENRANKTELLRIGRGLLGLASIGSVGLTRHTPYIMTELERYTGLVYWDEYAALTNPAERVRACVAHAARVWSEATESERGPDPREAIGEFSSCTAMLAGVYGRMGEDEKGIALLTQIDRLRPLSPAVQIAADVVLCTAEGRRGWVAQHIRRGILERVVEPVPDLSEPTRIATRVLMFYYMGLEEAVMGSPLALSRADELETHLPYTALGWQLRIVAHLFQGQEKQADACRRKRDVGLVGQTEDGHVDTALGHESVAYVILGDLLAIKRVLPALRERAAAHPGWVPQYLLVDGAHEALRGDVPKALEQSERGVALVRPGEHIVWAISVARVAQLLLALGRVVEARDRARAAVELARSRPVIPPYVDLLEAILAHAEARLGEHGPAAERIRETVARAVERGTSGILLMELYAAQAQVALFAKDAPTFASVSKRIMELCARVDSKAFAARLSSLFRMSLGAGFEPVDAAARTFRPRMAAMLARIRTELELCVGAEERMSRVLGMVLQRAGVHQGFLYLNQGEGFTLVASRSVDPPPSEAEEWLLKWLQGFQGTGDGSETTSQGGTTFFADRYGLIALVTDDGGPPVAPGIVVLDCQGTHPRLVPDVVLRELADALLDAGDAPRDPE